MGFFSGSGVTICAQAQEADVVKTAVEVCSTQNILQSCPNACLTACRSTDFLLENTELCDAAMGAAPGSDAPNCPQIDAGEVRSLNACIQDRRNVTRKFGRIISRDPDRLKVVTAFFSERPDCAASTNALEAMFGCLAGETEVIQSEYNALGSLGIEDGPLNSTALKKLACSIDEDRLIEIDIGATALKSRASDLGDRLTDVASCRRAYAEWLDDRGTFCESNSFDNCESVIGVFQLELEDSLSGAAEQNKALSSVIHRLERDIGAITSLAIVSSFCQ